MFRMDMRPPVECITGGDAPGNRTNIQPREKSAQFLCELQESSPVSDGIIFKIDSGSGYPRYKFSVE